MADGVVATGDEATEEEDGRRGGVLLPPPPPGEPMPEAAAAASVRTRSAVTAAEMASPGTPAECEPSGEGTGPKT